MSIKKIIISKAATFTARRISAWSKRAVKDQNKILLSLVSTAADTQFGQDHHFSKITNYEEFKAAIPIRDYEDLKPYIDKIIDGGADILWPGKPKYFAKTSGTTSGIKYIPITPDSIPNHIATARNAMLNYIH
ncbi:MAG: GH3 auxin-responsive promoter family protein, partial [Saprospiraceae bacterium]|nr:GH3 auxin-responsive promoter family protein [Saprospiraceae bacterium]